MALAIPSANLLGCRAYSFLKRAELVLRVSTTIPPQRKTGTTLKIMNKDLATYFNHRASHLMCSNCILQCSF